MTDAEIAILLEYATTYDSRVTVTEVSVQAWAELLGDVEFGAAMEALTRHYARSRERIMPSDLLDMTVRAARPDPVVHMPPRGNADPVHVSRVMAEMRATLARARHDAAAGTPPEAQPDAEAGDGP